VILDAAVDGKVHRVEVAGSRGRYTVTIDGRALEVDWRPAGSAFASLIVVPEGRSYDVGFEARPGGYRVLVGSEDFAVELLETARAAPAAARRAAAGPARLVAPMPGRIVRVLAEPGQAVEAGQGLVVMEAMKMENELRSPRAGRVAEVHARERQTVEMGALLVVVD
jgi:acetyl/propionyl-CoA carboxylase alpha subunit